MAHVVFCQNLDLVLGILKMNSGPSSVFQGFPTGRTFSPSGTDVRNDGAFHSLPYGLRDELPALARA